MTSTITTTKHHKKNERKKKKRREILNSNKGKKIILTQFCQYYCDNDHIELREKRASCFPYDSDIEKLNKVKKRSAQQLSTRFWKFSSHLFFSLFFFYKKNKYFCFSLSLSFSILSLFHILLVLRSHLNSFDQAWL